MKSARTPAIAVLLTALASAPLAAQEGKAAVPAFAVPAASKPLPQGYLIGPDDVLEVVYWGEKDLSAEAVVRPDGNISLPLLRDVPAIGLTPDELSERVQKLASTYLEHPSVTVVVKQINSRKVFITGEVTKPGTYPLPGPTTVLQLIATAGGLTPFARQERIVVMRAGENGPVAYRFNYKNVSQMKNLRDNIVLAPGDTIIVP
jgi:polysaccharide biosynthesis/export protein